MYNISAGPFLCRQLILAYKKFEIEHVGYRNNKYSESHLMFKYNTMLKTIIALLSVVVLSSLTACNATRSVDKDVSASRGAIRSSGNSVAIKASPLRARAL
ncbi:MAG: hypothetical protein GPOALKHO_001528 [Sodalis sp.]|nr:MAG: hypothetical protein GPOALKHO_001528 [Sodalis sp.]